MMNAALAVRVDTIYQGELPVSAQSEAVKNQVLPQALQQVFVKVSGNSKVVDNPNLKSHLNDAGSLAQEFGYASSHIPTAPYLLTIQFDPEGVNKLLRDAAVPIWGINRPLILAWVDYEIPNHPAEVIDSSSQTNIQNLLKQHANLRGVPIIFPVMDVTDLNQVSASDIMVMAIPKLQAAAKRYASDALLIARISQINNGYSTQAKLILADKQWDWTVSGPALTDVLNRLVDNVADTLSESLATVVANTVQGKVTIKVMGIAAQDDFAQMMHYLEHLTPVASIQVVKISGSNVTLNVTLHSSQQSFMQILSLGNKLTSVSSGANDKTLVYQWNH